MACVLDRSSRRAHQVRGRRPAQDGRGCRRVDRARIVCLANSVHHALIEAAGGRRVQVRAVQRGGEAPRGPAAGGGQPWATAPSGGAAGERQRLVRAPRALLSHDCEAAAQVQMKNAYLSDCLQACADR